MTVEEFITKFNPCEDAKAFLLTKPSLQSAWEDCKRSDWMFWALDKMNYKFDPQIEHDLCTAFVIQTPLHDWLMAADLLTVPRTVAAWCAVRGAAINDQATILRRFLPVFPSISLK